MKKSLIILLMMTTSFTAISATNDVTRNAHGYGSTYQEALSAALLEAVRQVRGLEVGTEKILRSSISSTVGDNSISIKGNESVAVDIYTKSQGWVKTYEVIDIVKPQSENDQWEVHARVTIPVYKEAITNDSRKTIAVLPFDVAFSDVMSKNTRLTVENISERVSEGIISELTQSRKFSVVNRSYEKQFNDERALLKSSQVSPAEAGRLGRKLGADFIIVGKIHSMDINKEEKSFYGTTNTSYDGTINLFFSVIEAPTEKVMWADTLEYTYQGKEEEKLLTELLSGLSSEVTSNIMDVIYPIKVLELQSPEEILLNQGGKRLSEGQLMDIFTPGRTIVDPDTNMPIKIDGRKVAQIQITSVLPKYSIAKLVSGTYEKIKINAITRHSIADTTPPPLQEKTLSPGSSDKPWSWD